MHEGAMQYPGRAVITNSAVLSPGAMEKDKGLSGAFWLGIVAF